jgi:hypothetical protein
VRQIEKAVLRALRDSGLGKAVVLPLPVGHGDDQRHNYVFGDDDAEPEPAVPFDEIGWMVSVRPASAFEWRAVRDALAARGRTAIDETNDAIEIGARDEDDAQALVAELSDLPEVGAMEARPLGRLGRWRVRQLLLGNYGVDGKPVDPRGGGGSVH